MHKNPINTPIMNASELIDGVEQYNAYDAGGKKNISISMTTTMIFNRTKIENGSYGIKIFIPISFS